MPHDELPHEGLPENALGESSVPGGAEMSGEVRNLNLLGLRLDRQGSVSLSEQIYAGIAAAIRDGRLRPGARLPSWRDLASHLAVARGTVRVGYDRLADENLINALGAAGTFVTQHLPAVPPATAVPVPVAPLADMFPEYHAATLPLQIGVPAQDSFPFKVWSRLSVSAARVLAVSPLNYMHPCGDSRLRQEIAAYLSLTRGMACAPAQIIVTGGYAGGLGIALRALQLEQTTAWVENPGYPFARKALDLARITTVPVNVDQEGMVVEDGIAAAPNAAAAIVTPAQQAPLGMPMSRARREALLQWADRAKAWVIEDDYLSELQLVGRAAPALASLDTQGRVIHIGTFSKTMSPAIRIGFLAVPASLAAHFADVAAVLSPSTGIGTQLALAEFMRAGHYLRHVRRMKQLYQERRSALRMYLSPRFEVEPVAGPNLLLRLPAYRDDTEIAARVQRAGLAPIALSPWYAQPNADHLREPQHQVGRGLLISAANVPLETTRAYCMRLDSLLRN